MNVTLNRADYSLVIKAALPELQMSYTCDWNFSKSGFDLSEFMNMGKQPVVGYIFKVTCFSLYRTCQGLNRKLS